LEEQFVEEVEELIEKAEEADAEDLSDETSVPEEIACPNARLEKIREAKQTIEERAQKRVEEEKAVSEEKMEKRREEEKETGRKKPGPKPEPPEDPGLEPGNQVNLTDEKSRIMFTSDNGFQQAYNPQATEHAPVERSPPAADGQRSPYKTELPPVHEALEADSVPAMGDDETR